MLFTVMVHGLVGVVAPMYQEGPIIYGKISMMLWKYFLY